MVIIKPRSDTDEPFYSNLYEKESHPVTIEPFLNILRRYKIEIPRQMIDEIVQDGDKNIGNKDVTHYLVTDNTGNEVYKRENKFDEGIYEYL